MIESINQAGGAGGGVQSVVAGTGISVDNTDPENPIVNSAGIDTDEKAKVSANDTTAGYLNGKLVAGSGIGFTENNNGGNETLTVAVSNLDAGAITTGTIATARLGTGTASSSTYLKGDQTYSGIDAGHITTGTVGTARLATGTANSTTFLRGDQTWASVSAGDTKYVVTLSDVENTTTATDIWSITVPANTWADGEIIYVDTVIYMLNNTGVGQNLTYERRLNGSLLGTSYTASIGNATTQLHHWSRNVFQRQGANLVYTVQGTEANFLMRYTQTYSNPSIGYQNFLSTAATFTSDITLTTNFKWANANANLYARMMNAVAFKLTGQYS